MKLALVVFYSLEWGSENNPNYRKRATRGDYDAVAIYNKSTGKLVKNWGSHYDDKGALCAESFIKGMKHLRINIEVERLKAILQADVYSPPEYLKYCDIYQEK